MRPQWWLLDSPTGQGKTSVVLDVCELLRGEGLGHRIGGIALQAEFQYLPNGDFAKTGYTAIHLRTGANIHLATLDKNSSGELEINIDKPALDQVLKWLYDDTENPEVHFFFIDEIGPVLCNKTLRTATENTAFYRWFEKYLDNPKRVTLAIFNATKHWDIVTCRRILEDHPRNFHAAAYKNRLNPGTFRIFAPYIYQQWFNHGLLDEAHAITTPALRAAAP